MRYLFAVLILAAFAACSPSESLPTACSPACAAGQVCVNAQCLAPVDGGGDAADSPQGRPSPSGRSMRAPGSSSPPASLALPPPRAPKRRHRPPTPRPRWSMGNGGAVVTKCDRWLAVTLCDRSPVVTLCDTSQNVTISIEFNKLGCVHAEGDVASFCEQETPRPQLARHLPCRRRCAVHHPHGRQAHGGRPHAPCHRDRHQPSPHRPRIRAPRSQHTEDPRGVARRLSRRALAGFGAHRLRAPPQGHRPSDSRKAAPQPLETRPSVEKTREDCRTPRPQGQGEGRRPPDATSVMGACR